MSTVFTEYKLSKIVPEYHTYSKITIQNSMGNCKHCFLDGSNGLATIFRKYPEKALDGMKKIFAEVKKLTFATNANNIKDIKTLAKHFEMISCTAIPTGYHGDYQYHAIFFTTFDTYNSYKYYRKRMETELPFLVDSFGNKLNSINIDLEKINAYKSIAWLKKYINELFS